MGKRKTRQGEKPSVIRDDDKGHGGGSGSGGGVGGEAD